VCLRLAGSACQCNCINGRLLSLLLVAQTNFQPGRDATFPVCKCYDGGG
jgi:hypothetical protein